MVNKIYKNMKNNFSKRLKVSATGYKVFRAHSLRFFF